MTRLCLVALALAATLVGSLAPSVTNARSKKSAVYYPDATWQRKTPTEVSEGFVRQAVAAVRQK